MSGQYLLENFFRKFWLAHTHSLVDERVPSGQAAEDAKVAGQIYPRLWEVCTTKLLATPIQLGGPCTVVQIDESFYEPCMVNSLKNSFVQKANKTLPFYTVCSTTNEEPTTTRCGHLEWWMCLSHGNTCRMFPTELPKLCFQSFKSTPYPTQSPL